MKVDSAVINQIDQRHRKADMALLEQTQKNADASVSDIKQIAVDVQNQQAKAKEISQKQKSAIIDTYA